MNRREFLLGSLTFVGLGAGCQKSQPTPTPSFVGERRDPSFSEGHRLRHPDFPPKPARVERHRVAILGGGISGLSAAWRLTRGDVKDFVLLELEPELGGNSRALTYPATPAPIGAHYLPIPNEEAFAVRRLLQEMGVLRQRKGGGWELDRDQLCHSPHERLFYQGSWYEGLLPEELLDTEGRRQAKAFTEHVAWWRRQRDSKGHKVFALPLAFSSQDPKFTRLDRQSFASYADAQGWTNPVLRWYLDYACRDDFGATLHTCSAWAGLHYFCSRDGGGLGTEDDILVWPEGNNHLVRFLRSQIAAESCRAESLVIKAEPHEQGVMVDYWDRQAKERVRLEVEAAVCCLPTFMRSFVVPGEPKRSEFEYAPWITANLSLRTAPMDWEGSGFIAWDNVFYGTKSLGYVVATHQQMAYDPLRPTVWTWYRPFLDKEPALERQPLLDASWQSWSEMILSELELAHPDIRNVCERLDVTVLGHGMIRPSIGFLFSDEIRSARQARGRLFFGHGDLSGMSLFEESQYRGVLAAEKAMATIGYATESFLET